MCLIIFKLRYKVIIYPVLVLLHVFLEELGILTPLGIFRIQIYDRLGCVQERQVFKNLLLIPLPGSKDASPQREKRAPSKAKWPSIRKTQKQHLT